jgi:hypothetical protein
LKGDFKMTYKDIEASRNTRLWITQVIVPVATLATSTIIAVPEARKAICKGAKHVKESIKKTFTKKESKTENRTVISIDANNRQEALAALEALAKEVFESANYFKPIKKKVQFRDSRKA